MNTCFLLVTGALAADCVLSSVQNVVGRIESEKRGHLYNVLDVYGNTHEHVLVNHRGKLLTPLPLPDFTDLHQHKYADLVRQTQSANRPEKRTGIVLIQMEKHPEYVYDARLGCPTSPCFAHGSFVCDDRVWDSSRVCSSLLERCLMRAVQAII